MLDSNKDNQSQVTYEPSKFYPVIFVRYRVEGDACIFRFNSHEVRVGAPKKIIDDIVELCDGTHSLDEVVDKLSSSWKGAPVRELLDSLIAKNVIVQDYQSCDLLWSFIKNSSYQTSVLPEIEKKELFSHVAKSREQFSGKKFSIKSDRKELALYKSFTDRKSVIIFGEQDISESSLEYMLWAAYGIIKQNPSGSVSRTVPSAGALNPLRVSLVLIRSVGNLSAGVYHVRYSEDGAIDLYQQESDYRDVYTAFIDPAILETCTGLIFLSASFQQTARKYGNRAMLYAPLEAGHSAQNIHMAAADLELATREIGGYYEDSVARLLECPVDYQPLVSILFGGKPSEKDRREYEESFAVEGQVLPKGSIGYNSSFTTIFAKRKGASSWSSGKDKCPAKAFEKALTEAREWGACSEARSELIESSYKNLSSAVHPHKYFRFMEDQYEEQVPCGCQFNEDCLYKWKGATEYFSKNEAHILADCVCFPYASSRRYMFANSNGLAAFPSFEGAFERSVLESVERDAFQVCWLNQLEMPTISHESLPEDLRRRVGNLERHGFAVYVKDISLDLAPVLLVFVKHKDKNLLAVTSACKFSKEAALDHALMEVESAADAALRRSHKEEDVLLVAENVMAVTDHEKYYCCEENIDKADVFLRGEVKSFEEVANGFAKSFQELLSQIEKKFGELYVIDFSYTNVGELTKSHIDKCRYIVKSLIPGLVPMSFGFNQEPLGVQRLFELPVQLELISEKREISELPRYPHPFA